MRISFSTLWLFLLIATHCFLTVSTESKTTSTTARIPSIPSENETTSNKRPPPTNITNILDVRTPPKIKQMMKKAEQKHHIIENSHPGVAVPIDVDSIGLEDSKKMNFHKLEPKSTTDSGLSTWILLSGQTMSSTQKPIKSSSSNKNETKNITIGNPNRVVKPVFKKKPTSGGLSTSTMTMLTTKEANLISTTQKNNLVKTENEKTTLKTILPTTTEKIPSTLGEIITKISKIKTTTLSNLKEDKKDKEILKIQSTTTKNEKPTTTIEKITTSTEKILTKLTEVSTTENISELKPELKEGELELATTTNNSKKNRRPSQKKKKNKNRTRRPTTAEDKSDSDVKTNKTKIATKDKPISTQIYNYLAREVMPTVGVGLVGLVVTAGLATYFLYPYGPLRRSYEVDRRDKDNVYYYDNVYSGGVPEEEAIGKVIAGMPFYSNDYRRPQQTSPASPMPKHSYSNRYRHSDNYYNPQATVEEVQLDPLKDYKHDGNYLQESYQTNEVHKNEPITYNKDVIAKNVEASYSTSDQQYVVGNLPKEVQVQEVTPVAVPEHGPRSLKIRRRRDVLKKNNNLRFNRRNFKIGK